MKLIIALIILIGLIGALCYAKKKLKELSLQLFGTESIQEGLEKQADEQALTPKSVCGMAKDLRAAESKKIFRNLTGESSVRVQRICCCLRLPRYRTRTRDF